MKLLPVIFLLALTSATSALDNGLMRTPPMGWMRFYFFGGSVFAVISIENDPKNCISENLFRDMADRLAEEGWKEMRYDHVMIDDCWSSLLRDKDGQLQPDPQRFPGGIAKLARYLHDRGLKLVIYGDLGTHTHTCGGYPGTTLDKIETDAQRSASWGVDFRKLDGCYSNEEEQQKGYPLMSKALNATGCPIGYSCSWPAYRGGLPPSVNYTLLGEICNLWRNYDDTQDSWDSVQDITDWFFDNQGILQPEAGPGRWNDPDMLIIGNVGLSVDQSRAQMALWAIMVAPLIMSNNLRTLSSEARAILQNRAAIAINQDPMGVQGRRLHRRGGHVEVYWRPLSQSASALVSLSRRQDMAYHCHTSLAKLNYTAGSYEAYDVFTGKTLSGLSATTEFPVSINPSGVVMWYVYPKMHYEHPQDDGRYPYIRQKYRMSSSLDFHKPRVVPPSLL
ncbi:alpha-N-acetylgalactosaminidase-like [Oncorhynchus clarkii lewisi]|uniref:alpha-N-acetylgalactosaminidase-like n=1 Tax=Oncorhynchus clarkii lewisi TaxID=490388 RepID=UPI0039B995C9